MSVTPPPTATPFSKILVANRGEIALRVMRSARAAAYRTVAVYSMADARAPHVLAADQAVCIGGARPAESYLHIAALIDAAHRTGADALHPGYGFLAENETFAQACVDAGLVFIGPSPAAIAAMGDKAQAKRLMGAAGVPCVPGYQGSDQGEQRLAAEAAAIGYPVMIKAVAGGGGRGMRLVAAAGDFVAALRSAQSEALNAFGDATVILERALVEPRHIEVQVFADRQGNAIHLGERDCSVQRRHQKLIEEAPSPAVDAALRARMGAVAVQAVQAIGYEGAGTLEFLLDREGHFFFMEMNTRLQVEHPVTEAITGLDLVALQLRVAAGEPLPLRQDDVHFEGHAIEVRLCAEDPDQGFLPQSGTLALWRPPAGLRVDHALADGAEVPPFYDSMIAKLVAHGRNRDEARRRLLLGLQDLVALGLRSNQAFLARCLVQAEFVAGQASTAFIGRHQTALLADDPAARQRAAAMAAALLLATAPGAAAQSAMPLTLTLGLRFSVDGHPLQARVQRLDAQRLTIQIGDTTHTLEGVAQEAARAHLICDGVMQCVMFHRDGPRLLLHLAGRPWEVIDLTHAPAIRTAGDSRDGRLRASMNGRVAAVLVQVGQAVQAGQPLLTLEAMKMEHVHAAPRAGVVSALYVSVGQQVPAQRVLAEVTAEAPAATAAAAVQAEGRPA